MARFTYSAAQLAFIESGFKEVGVPELAEAFNAKFKLEKSASQIRAAIKNHGFTCGRKPGHGNKGQLRSFTPEQAAYIKAGYLKWTITELTFHFNKHFKESKRETQIRAFTRNHRIRSGRDGTFEKGSKSWNSGTKGLVKPNSGNFKRDHQPANFRPVGSERVNVDGYIEIKVADPGEWRQKQRLVYEQEHGPIPDGHNVRFIDGDRKNCDPGNLALVCNLTNAILNNRYKMNQQPQEHRESLLLMAKLDAKLSQIEAKG